MIDHHQQKCALTLVLACFVAGAVAFAYAKYQDQASSDVPLLSCPAGQEDAMQYFVMRKDLRENHYLSGEANPSYTKVFPDADFAPTGYWFWLKSSEAHGFDIKAFDEKYIYIRGTELNWKDNTTFKRKEQDTPRVHEFPSSRPRCCSLFPNVEQLGTNRDRSPLLMRAQHFDQRRPMCVYIRQPSCSGWNARAVSVRASDYLSCD